MSASKVRSFCSRGVRLSAAYRPSNGSDKSVAKSGATRSIVENERLRTCSNLSSLVSAGSSGAIPAARSSWEITG